MLLVSTNLLLLSNAVTSRRDKSILYSRSAICILLYTSLLIYFNTNIIFLENAIGIFGGLLYCKSHNFIFTLFILIISSLILILTSFYPRKIWLEEYSSIYHMVYYKFIYFKTEILNKMSEQYKLLEYPLIILFIITGSIFLISSSDLISVFLSIELQSYGLYLISTIYRNSELSTNAGLTYFLLGGLSSCIILLGQSLLYVNTGNTNLDGLYIINSISQASILDDSLNLTYTSGIYQFYLQFSLVVMSVGFLFKISAAPFHFWSPDVYDAIPTVVTTFVAIIAKISILIFFLELVYYTSSSLLNITWKNNLLLSSLLSLFIGSILGLTQFRIKRLFAYSTISHIGFILLALSINTTESIQAFFFYLMQYSISNLNAFILLITIGYTFFNLVYKNKKDINDKLKTLKDVNFSSIQLIHQIRGYFYINPILAISLAITLFSFIGVPPLVGFFAKQMILSAALDSGYVFMTLVAIITSVISAVYYLVVVKEVFFDKDEYVLNDELDNKNLNLLLNKNNMKEKVSFNINNVVLSSSLSSIISIITLIILLFIFMTKECFNMTNILALILFHA